LTRLKCKVILKLSSGKLRREFPKPKHVHNSTPPAYYCQGSVTTWGSVIRLPDMKSPLLSFCNPHNAAEIA
jgi:hypothetical protein